jgi:hypothetical protein
MDTAWRIAITLAVVAAMTLLWIVDDRVSRRPGYRRKLRVWHERYVEWGRVNGFRRPTFAIWAALSGVILLALLWAAR